MVSRKIIHVDMDCFYAAVETKHRPELRGHPVGIGGPPQSRSVLCTANYEARKFKVRAAMPTSMALRLCPYLILVPPHFDLYKEESRAIREIFSRFTSKIEPLSLDEAYLDVTGSPHFGGSATLIAQEIRRLIREERQLTASAGISTNKFIAKVASDWNKPDGQFLVSPPDIEKFVRELPIEKIYGVGPKTAEKMHELGLFTCADLQAQSPLQMQRWFGSRGPELQTLSQGIDHRPVESSTERKSLTVEETFPKDLQTVEEGLAQIPELYRSWESRMMAARDLSAIRGFVIKVKFFDFKSTTHEVTSSAWPRVEDFQKLFLEAWNRRCEPIRLIGLGVRLGTPSRTEDLNLTLDLESWGLAQ